MSLDWSIDGCDNWEEIALGADIEGPITDSIIWGCMVTKLGEVTEDNWSEWYARYAVWNRINCFEFDLKPKDVHRRIGLSTNVFPAEPRSKWINSLVKRELDKCVSHALYAVKEKLDEAFSELEEEVKENG